MSSLQYQHELGGCLNLHDFIFGDFPCPAICYNIHYSLSPGTTWLTVEFVCWNGDKSTDNVQPKDDKLHSQWILVYSKYSLDTNQYYDLQEIWTHDLWVTSLVLLSLTWAKQAGISPLTWAKNTFNTVGCFGSNNE